MNRIKVIKKVVSKIVKKGLSNPKQYESPKEVNDAEILRMIRQDIIAEYDAINLYEAHKQSIKDPVLKKLLEHIITEEKQHAAELQNYLNTKDKEQKDILEKEMNNK